MGFFSDAKEFVTNLSNTPISPFGGASNNTLPQKHNDAVTDRDSMPPVTTRANRRTTVDTSYSIFTEFSWIEPDDESVDWRLKVIDEENLANISARDLIKLLINASPDVDRALHDFIRHCNSNWTLRGETPAAQQILDDFLKRMDDNGQSLNLKIEKALSGAFTTGAFFMELIFDENGRDAVDLAVIDPMMAKYKRSEDPVRGQFWELGQIIDNEFVSLHDDVTITYQPINPVVDNPFGRPLINSAIFAVVFQLGLIKSTRQVVETQAWPKGIWTVDRKLLYDTDVPPNRIDEIVESTKLMLENVWSRIKKTQSPIVGSEVDYKIVTAMNRNSLSGVDMLERILERHLVRALKTQPVIFGATEGITDAQADVQLIDHGLFINSVQVNLEDILTYFFTLVLRAAGDPSKPFFQFDRLNSAELKRNAEVMRSQFQAWRIALDGNFLSPFEIRRDFERANIKMDISDPEDEAFIRRIYEATIKAKELAAEPQPITNPDSGSTGGGGNPPTSVNQPTNQPTG